MSTNKSAAARLESRAAQVSSTSSADRTTAPAAEQSGVPLAGLDGARILADLHAYLGRFIAYPTAGAATSRSRERDDGLSFPQGGSAIGARPIHANLQPNKK